MRSTGGPDTTAGEVDRAEAALLGADTGATPVGVLVPDTVVQVPVDATLREVASALTREGVGAVLVVDGERAHGVLSERDVVAAVAAGTDLDEVRASQVDSRDIIACTPDTTVDVAARLLMEEYVRHLVVEQDGTPTGVVSARDLLGVYSA